MQTIVIARPKLGRTPSGSPCGATELLLWPTRPVRIVGDDIQQDVAIRQEEGHVSRGSRVSAMISSVLMRVPAEPRKAAKRLPRRRVCAVALVAMIRCPTGS